MGKVNYVSPKKVVVVDTGRAPKGSRTDGGRTERKICPQSYLSPGIFFSICGLCIRLYGFEYFWCKPFLRKSTVVKIIYLGLQFSNFFFLYSDSASKYVPIQWQRVANNFHIGESLVRIRSI